MIRQLTATSEHAGVRLDAFLSADGQLSRSQAARLIEEGRVTMDGRPAAKSCRVAEGQQVTVDIPEVKDTAVEAQDIPLDVVYEDGDVIVVNKPTGLVVHPAPGHPDGTLVNALLHHCGDSLSGIGGEMRPGIVHRIDRDTSGLLIVAKNDFAHQSLSAQLADRSLSRVYEAVVHGGFRADSGTVNAPIGRHPVDRKRMAVTEKNSRHAVTHWEVIERYAGFTHIRCRLETGRTHQIRVHMAHIGHPLLGDMVYGAGKPEKGLEGQCLHARTLKFIHPRTGEHMELTSPLPEYFTAVLARLGPPLDNQ
ncbi:MAG TPA: RNA pseudouridine synthase [Oscillibacter sp.]|nr:RNA pseudouridine synthase [Oscillibacter sp.]